jgi:hypothetical protein
MLHQVDQVTADPVGLWKRCGVTNDAEYVRFSIEKINVSLFFTATISCIASAFARCVTRGNGHDHIELTMHAQRVRWPLAQGSDRFSVVSVSHPPLL